MTKELCTLCHEIDVNRDLARKQFGCFRFAFQNKNDRRFPILSISDWDYSCTEWILSLKYEQILRELSSSEKHISFNGGQTDVYTWSNSWKFETGGASAQANLELDIEMRAVVLEMRMRFHFKHRSCCAIEKGKSFYNKILNKYFKTLYRKYSCYK